MPKMTSSVLQKAQAIALIKDTVSQCISKAYALYGTNFDQVELSFKSKGLSGATAWTSNGRYGIQFNSQMLESKEGIDILVNKVIPHEVAHLVCFKNPRLGKDHNAGWKRICISLGGTGNRTESMNLKRKRKSEFFVYDIGSQKVHLGKIRHNKLQSKISGYKVNGTQILPEHWTGESVILE